MFELGFTTDDAKRAAWTFAQAFVVVLGAGMSNLLDAFKAGGLDGAQAAGLALVSAALAAGISALKNAVLSDESGLK